MIKIRTKKPESNELQGIAMHDANGNMTVMPGLKAKYDAWNRLVDVRNSDDLLMATYEYNGLNQRIKKTVNSVVTKSFFNENWQELESVVNNQITSYVWGLRYIDDLILREKGEERLYSLADPNWNVAAIVDANGAVVERYTYDAFGKRNVFDGSFTVKTNTDYNWNRAFTGQVLDTETGMMLYKNRYYHTGVGRFINRDPAGYQTGGINLYLYTRNSSTNFTDILGYFPSLSWGKPQPPDEARKGECCNIEENNMKKICKKTGEEQHEAGVVCCDGVMISCNWDPNRNDGKNSPGQESINKCILVHEDTHYTNTQKCPNKKGTSRPEFEFPGIDKNKNREEYEEAKRKDECNAHKEALKCLTSELNSLPKDTPEWQKVYKKRLQLANAANNRYDCKMFPDGSPK